MIHWFTVDVQSVISLYLSEKRRRENPSSLTGRMDEIPSTAPSSGDWEMLCWLMRWVPKDAVEVLMLLRYGEVGTAWDEKYIELDSGIRIPLLEQIALRPTYRAVARRLGYSVDRVKMLEATTHEVVAGNLGILRAKLADERREEVRRMVPVLRLVP